MKYHVQMEVESSLATSEEVESEVKVAVNECTEKTCEVKDIEVTREPQ